jgi:cold shock protein
MAQGVIKKLVSDKGFGFISRSDGNDLFFHRSAVEGVDFDTLREGQKVEFAVGSGPKGPAAESVRVI